MKRIVWLASYPKSGNTWFRIFLANYLRDAEQPISINEIAGSPIASARAPFDQSVGYDSGELSFDEVDRLRPEVYQYLARHSDARLYFKIHDAYTWLPDGRPLIPPEATHCALYFIRNPLDVCVSFAHHNGHANYDKTIAEMSDPAHCVSASVASSPNQLRQRLLSWSGHCESWADARGFPIHIVRYEDLALFPRKTFAAAARFIELPDDEARLDRAIAFSAFESLRTQEEAKGFRERSPKAERFFRNGAVGDWRRALNPRQIERLVADHRPTMQRFGYLDASGHPLH